jgi:hypothetical protein
VGLAALVVTGIWWSSLRPPPVADVPPPHDAAPPPPPPSEAPKPAPASAPAPLAALRWRVEGRAALPAPAELERCLRDLGHDEAVASAAADGVEVRIPGMPAPLRFTASGGALQIETPRSPDRRLTLAAHLAAGACLRADGATLVDPELDRRFTGAEWPAPSARGGIPVTAVVAVDAVPGALVTRGLGRLDLPEIGLVAGADAGADHKLLQHAIVALVVGGVPGDGLLSLGAEKKAGLSAASKLTGLPAALAAVPDRLVLTEPGSPQPLRAAAAPPEPAPRPRHHAVPRPAPAFRPDYR